MANIKKRLAAIVCAAAMAITGLPTGINAPLTVEAECLPGLTDLGRQVAAEGCVLIKNDENVLPLENGVSISVFGRAQCNYYKSGTGSGGDVKVPYTTGILEGLRKNKKVEVNEELAAVYADWVKDHPFDNGGGGWAAEPWFQEEMPLTQAVVNAAKAKSDVAVVLIGRTAGEDADSANKEGSYLLTQKERDMLEKVTDTFDKVVVLLNVPAIMDMTWMNDYPIDSVMYVWQGGMTGGDAVADVVTGDVNPSGRLTDTIARDYTDYPSSANFGRTDYNYYVEDIYVGYRYFETFAQDKVLYPFGYGLSYTTFETSTYSVTETKNAGKKNLGQINVFVTVENTGSRAGKETVQVYYGAPQGTLGNPAKELAAFAKTKLLQPGESQDLTLTFDVADMAPYDDSGASGHDSCYVLEAGDYNIYVGNDVRSSQLEYVHTEKETKVVEQLAEEMAPVKAFKRMKAEVDETTGDIQLGEEDVPLQTVNVAEKIVSANTLLEELQPKDDGKHYNLIDVYEGKVTTEEFVAQMSNNQLSSIVRGEGMEPSGVTAGIASAFGGVNVLEEDENGNVLETKTTLTELYGIPRAGAADGPSGIRQTNAATSIPGGASIACTWNLDLVERLLQLEGEEMVLNEIDTILGPGINIHRNPLNGRNFEYYSEDPLLTGMMAAAFTRGIQSTGATVTVKHFAANNQETNRHHDDSRVSERALREIYLKAFEIAVKDGNARSIMTSYNPVNGIWTASNYDLVTDILRKEWGYTGVVMTDWWARMNQEVGDGNKTTSGTQHMASMVKAQNDMYMVVPDSSSSVNNDNIPIDIQSSLESGDLTRPELQRCAVNICNYLLKSQAFARLNNLDFNDVKYTKAGEHWFSVGKSAMGNPKLTSLSVDGRNIASFNANVVEYNMDASEDDIPQVSATAAAGSTVTKIEQATAESPVAKVYVSAGGEEIIYRVIFNLGLVKADAKADAILVNGKPVEGFDPSILNYDYALKGSGNPVVTAEVPEGVTVEKAEYDEAKKTATVTCTAGEGDGKGSKTYTIYFGDAPTSDNFEGEGLNPVWTIENESNAEWSLTDNHLVINTEMGSFYEGQNDGKNQFVQDAYGDWEAVAKLDLDQLPYQNYHSLGIVARQDDDNYIDVKIEYSTNLLIALTQESGGKINELERLADNQLEKFNNTKTVYLKLTKKGNTYSAAVSPDGKNYVKFSKKATADYTHPQFLLHAGHGSESAPGIAAKFDYVAFSEPQETVIEPIQVSANTILKVAEEEPVEITDAISRDTCTDEDGGSNFTNCNKGQYADYKVNVEKTGMYNFTARMMSDSKNAVAQLKFSINVDGENAAGFSLSGGATKWTSVSGSASKKLTAGEHTLRVYFDTSDIKLNWIQIELEQAADYDDAALSEAIADAKNLDISKAPVKRQEEFKKALEAAEKAMQEAETQADIDAAIAVLEKAIENLNKPIELTSIKLGATKVTLDPGNGVAMTYTTVPEYYTDELKWDSSDKKVAVVDENGVITGISKGTATITVSNGKNVKATFIVNVGVDDVIQPPTEKPPVGQTTTEQPKYMDKVTVTINKKSLYYGGNKDNTAQVTVKLPAGAEMADIAYGSNKKAATIDVAGKITAKSAGKTDITVKVTLTTGETNTWTFKDIKVTKAYIAKVKVPSSIKRGKSATLKAKAYGSSTKITWSLKKSVKGVSINKKTGKLKVKKTAKKNSKITVVATSGKIKQNFTIKVK